VHAVYHVYVMRSIYTRPRGYAQCNITESEGQFQCDHVQLQRALLLVVYAIRCMHASMLTCEWCSLTYLMIDASSCSIFHVRGYQIAGNK